MRNVTIFGNFTVLETFTLNYMNIDKGYDDRLEVFYRLNLYIEDNKTMLLIYSKIIITET